MKEFKHKTLNYFVIPINKLLAKLNKTEIIIYGIVRCSKNFVNLTINEYQLITGSSKATIIKAINNLIRMELIYNLSTKPNKYKLQCNIIYKLGHFNNEKDNKTLSDEQIYLINEFIKAIN